MHLRHLGAAKDSESDEYKIISKKPKQTNEQAY